MREKQTGSHDAGDLMVFLPGHPVVQTVPVNFYRAVVDRHFFNSRYTGQ